MFILKLWYFIFFVFICSCNLRILIQVPRKLRSFSWKRFLWNILLLIWAIIKCLHMPLKMILFACSPFCYGWCLFIILSKDEISFKKIQIQMRKLEASQRSLVREVKDLESIVNEQLIFLLEIVKACWHIAPEGIHLEFWKLIFNWYHIILFLYFLI